MTNSARADRALFSRFFSFGTVTSVEYELKTTGRVPLSPGRVQGFALPASEYKVVFTLRHSRHVGGRKQKISN